MPTEKERRDVQAHAAPIDAFDIELARDKAALIESRQNLESLEDEEREQRNLQLLKEELRLRLAEVGNKLNWPSTPYDSPKRIIDFIDESYGDLVPDDAFLDNLRGIGFQARRRALALSGLAPSIVQAMPNTGSPQLDLDWVRAWMVAVMVPVNRVEAPELLAAPPDAIPKQFEVDVGQRVITVGGSYRHVTDKVAAFAASLLKAEGHWIAFGEIAREHPGALDIDSDNPSRISKNLLRAVPELVGKLESSRGKGYRIAQIP